MTPSEIMRDLARDDFFPKAAMAAAGEQRDAMTPIFLEMVARIGRQNVSSMRGADLMALIPVFYLLGEWRVTDAYRPLLHMLRRPTKTIDHTLGDAVTGSVFALSRALLMANCSPCSMPFLTCKPTISRAAP